jgi:hypothetical protein
LAFPTVVGTPTETANATEATNNVIGHATGAATDLHILVICKGKAATINAHGDWTELLDENSVGGFYIAYHYGTLGTSTTLVASAVTRTAAIAYLISGAEDPATQAPQVGTTSSGSSVSPDPPTTTPTGGAKDYLWIAALTRAGEEADDDTWCTAAPATPSAFGSLLQKACGVAGTNLGGIVATATLESNAASMDPGVFTIATGAWRAQTIAVHPAPDLTVDTHRTARYGW